jgi:hypothetical protein
VAERRVGNEVDAQLAQQRQQFRLRITGPQGVLRLQGGDGMDGVGAADRAGAVLLASMPSGWISFREHLPSLLRLPGLFALIHLFSGRTLSPKQVMRLSFVEGRITPAQAERYAPLLQRESKRVMADLRTLTTAAGTTPFPLLVLGSRRDINVTEAIVMRTAAHYATQAVLLDEGCHDLMLDLAWQDSAARILRWLLREFP